MALPPLPCAWRAAVRVAALAGLVAVLLAACAGLVASLLAVARDVPWDAFDNFCVGLVCSLIGWLFVAAFHLPPEAVTVAVPEDAEFGPHVKAALCEMGYELTAETPELLTARPGFHALLFGGGIQVFLTGGQATLHGPKYAIELLRSRLRLRNHVQRMHGWLRHDRHFPEEVLTQVELSLRVRHDQLPAVQVNVLDVLGEAGKVVCELNVLVQGEVREGTLDGTVRGWLEQHGIPFEIHKGFVRFQEQLTLAQVAPHDVSV